MNEDDPFVSSILALFFCVLCSIHLVLG
jgi:hypothetical protein